jgi:hypothetical protein
MILKRAQHWFEGADAGAAAGAVVAAWVDGEAEEAADGVGGVEFVEERFGDDARDAVFLVVELVDPRFVDREFGETLAVEIDGIRLVVVAVAGVIAVAALGDQGARIA